MDPLTVTPEICSAHLEEVTSLSIAYEARGREIEALRAIIIEVAGQDYLTAKGF